MDLVPEWTGKHAPRHVIGEGRAETRDNRAFRNLFLLRADKPFISLAVERSWNM
jgi:hypothetical protein